MGVARYSRKYTGCRMVQHNSLVIGPDKREEMEIWPYGQTREVRAAIGINVEEFCKVEYLAHHDAVPAW